jgi:cell shape-determining protein MreD
MNARRLIFVSFGCGALLWTIFGQLNHYLTGLHASLFIGGLLVTFPALRLSYREGWKIAVLLGLWCDALSPVRFGLHAVLFLAALTFIHHVRDRFPRDELSFGIVVALITNAALFLVLTAGLIVRHPQPLSALPAILSDLLLSELALAAVTPWFFALQERALEIAGLSLRRGQRGLL